MTSRSIALTWIKYDNVTVIHRNGPVGQKIKLDLFGHFQIAVLSA